MTQLRIDVRERRDAEPGELVVPVDGAPMKEEPDTLVFTWTSAAGASLVLKVYRRVNLAHWLRKRLMGFRVRREFRTLVVLHLAGIPCPEPAFWGIGRDREQGRFEVVATHEVPGARPLSEVIATRPREEVHAAVWRVFETIAAMHRCGVYHGAPFLENVLTVHPPGADTSEICVIDLEKSVCFERDIRGTRMAIFDLLNLFQSTRRRLDGRAAVAALARYGLDEAEASRIVAACDAFRSSKFQRYRRRFEFLVHGWLRRRLAAIGRAIRGAGLSGDPA